MTDYPVTGGDLYILWHAAHQRLPEAKAVYDDAAATLKGDLAEGDEGKYGKAFKAWKFLLSTNQYIMSHTSKSIDISCKALDLAITNYKYVDGDNAKALTEAGSDLNGLVDKFEKGGGDD